MFLEVAWLGWSDGFIGLIRMRSRRIRCIGWRSSEREDCAVGRPADGILLTEIGNSPHLERGRLSRFAAVTVLAFTAYCLSPTCAATIREERLISARVVMEGLQKWMRRLEWTTQLGRFPSSFSSFSSSHTPLSHSIDSDREAVDKRLQTTLNIQDRLVPYRDEIENGETGYAGVQQSGTTERWTAACSMDLRI